MNVFACSFATNIFLKKQYLQSQYFIKAGFNENEIFLCGPNLLDESFYDLQPNASENNKFGWFTFKPYFLLKVLEKLDLGDLLLYMDVNDKPLSGIKTYLISKFSNSHIDFLVPSTNYQNIKRMSKFHKSILTKEFKLSSIFFLQPEAGVLAIRNSIFTQSLLRIWYEMSLVQACELDRRNDLTSRHDQETLFLLSRIYKTIKIESWFKYKLTGKGIRQFVDFEALRNI